jgi:peptidoglycan hydrolase CwlO-like protein
MSSSRRLPGHPAVRPLALALVASAIVATPALAASDPGTIQRKLSAAQQHANAVRGALHGDQAKVSAYQQRIDELKQQLAPLDDSLNADAAQLDKLQDELRTTRADLVKLRAAVKRDQKVLSAQLLAQYESPQPGLADVVVSAQGYSDLIARVSQLKQIAAQNAKVTAQVRTSKASADAQAKRLAALTSKQQTIVASETTKRDAVAHVKLQVVQQQLVYVKARDSKSSSLSALEKTSKTLGKQLAAAQRAAAKANGIPLSGGTSPSGAYGFFQAPGTSYTEGVEPTLVTRLNTLGKALHLHLIGLSGYRTPAHSVEVGGFANDPHTRGMASDTPGVEGVPEATLNAYGLTRPFPGPAEADHIQLRGSN